MFNTLIDLVMASSATEAEKVLILKEIEAIVNGLMRRDQNAD